MGITAEGCSTITFPLIMGKTKVNKLVLIFLFKMLINHKYFYIYPLGN